jgi:hypothetical protein
MGAGMLSFGEFRLYPRERRLEHERDLSGSATEHSMFSSL